MSCSTDCKLLNVNHLVRSVIILAIGLPVSIATTFALNQRPDKNYSQITQNLIKAQLTEPCLKWALAKPDSKLERTAKNSIDDILGGEVTHSDACQYVLQ